jgi:hypothetical protein
VDASSPVAAPFLELAGLLNSRDVVLRVHPTSAGNDIAIRSCLVTGRAASRLQARMRRSLPTAVSEGGFCNGQAISAIVTIESGPRRAQVMVFEGLDGDEFSPDLDWDRSTRRVKCAGLLRSLRRCSSRYRGPPLPPPEPQFFDLDGVHLPDASSVQNGYKQVLQHEWCGTPGTGGGLWYRADGGKEEELVCVPEAVRNRWSKLPRD